jgi:hypothetical protein
MIMISVLWYKTLWIRPGPAVRVLTGAVVVMGRWRSWEAHINPPSVRRINWRWWPWRSFRHKLTDHRRLLVLVTAVSADVKVTWSTVI